MGGIYGDDTLHCDLCTVVENAGDLTPDWNGETGNHLSCEGRPLEAIANEPFQSLDDLARAKGVDIYDTALPQGWVDDVKRKTGEWAPGHFVWSYDGKGIFGEPVPVDRLGERILDEYRRP